MKAVDIKLSISESKIIHSKTNKGELGKVEHLIIRSEGYEDTIYIVKYILADTSECKYLYKSIGFECVKQFKNKYLMKLTISFRISTFAKIYKEYFL